MLVKKLTKEEIEEILNLSSTEELLNVIEKTYKKVIATDSFELDEFELHFGPTNGTYTALNTDLVIGFRVSDAYLEKIEDENWVEESAKKRDILNLIIEEAENAINSALNTSGKIIEYDDISFDEEEVIIKL